jgi:hypothetical protein
MSSESLCHEIARANQQHVNQEDANRGVSQKKECVMKHVGGQLRTRGIENINSPTPASFVNANILLALPESLTLREVSEHQ